jgi:hypothetical protein
MRKIIVSNLVSLDGFFEGPNYQLAWHVVDEEFFADARELTIGSGKPLLRDITERLNLTLLGTRSLSSSALYQDTIV